MAAVVIAIHELRLRLHDRSVLILGLVAPFVLASIMGFALSGEGEEVGIVMADEDHSKLSARIVSGDLRPRDGADQTVRTVRDTAAAETAIADGTADAAIVIPRGFGEEVSGSKPLALIVIATRKAPLASAAAQAAARVVTNKVVAQTYTGTAGGIKSARVVDDPTLEDSSPLGYFGPSMAILFMYFSLGSGARNLLAERRQGTLARLRVAPIAFRAVVAGKLAAIFVVALAGMLALWIATMVIFDASWGSVTGVLVVSSATVVAIAGIAALIAARARDEASADAATGMIAFLLALLGGNFFPPGALPDLFEKGSRLTPNGAALQAFARLSIDNASLGEVLPAVCVLLVVGLFFGVWGFAGLTTRTTKA